MGNIVRYGLTYEEVESYLRKVVKSNESKFANTEEEALKSLTKEAERLNIPEDSLDYKEVDGVFVIFRGDGKILKSINYVSPEDI